MLFMKRKVKYVLSLLGTLVSLASFASCSFQEKSSNTTEIKTSEDKKEDSIITKVEINDKGEMVITYSDGTVVNFGPIKDNKLEAYDIAESFGYQEDYGVWLNEIVTGTLGVQYAVNVSKDYKSFTYGWNNETVTLDEYTILVDSRLTDTEVSQNNYIYNSINKAIESCKDGTENKPMKVYVAPGVYWTHDPNSIETTSAYQIEKTCQNMEWIGLTDDKRNVVIAFNYGHDRGYQGANPTCFKIDGDNFKISNMTIGGYCNIDLNYVLNKSLNVSKRTNDITQCQLGLYNGDKLYCKNVSFISRLNMNPFISSKRAFYESCHFESTDDALNGSSNSVYLNCDFDFYASKPWYSSSGSTLLNCEFNIVHINNSVSDNYQYLGKVESRFNLIDCNFNDKTNTYKVGWSDVLSHTYKGYYSNVTLNNKPIDLNLSSEYNHSVDLTGSLALKAYKLTDEKGHTIYNIYNLLKGSDNWDPLGQKELIESYNATDILDTLTLNTSKTVLETANDNENSTIISYILSGKGNKDYNDTITYTASDPSIVKIEKEDDGSAKVTANSNLEETKNVIITAKGESGLEAAIELTIKPSILPIDKATNISITQNDDSTASVDYTISNLGERLDNSKVEWYICEDSKGTNPIHIATSRDDTPLKTINLYSQYVGYYLMVTVASKHIRSNYQEEVTFVSSEPVFSNGINQSLTYNVDLSTLPTEDYSNYKEGYWYKDSVGYGTGWKNGFLDYTGLYFTGSKTDKENNINENFSEIYYTPLKNSYGDMDIKLTVAPGKTAGQGFGSNDNFFEVKIKYDKASNSGYALRIVRNSGDSTKVQLVKIELGNVTVLTESTSTSVFLTEVSIHLWTEGTKLNAHLETTTEQPSTSLEKGYIHTVDISCEITRNTYGGCGLYLESSTGDNTVFVGTYEISWTKSE